MLALSVLLICLAVAALLFAIVRRLFPELPVRRSMKLKRKNHATYPDAYEGDAFYHSATSAPPQAAFESDGGEFGGAGATEGWDAPPDSDGGGGGGDGD